MTFTKPMEFLIINVSYIVENQFVVISIKAKTFIDGIVEKFKKDFDEHSK